MIIEIAERIASLPPEEQSQIGPALGCNLKHPKPQPISTENMDLGSQGGARCQCCKGWGKGEDSHGWNWWKLDSTAKLKVIKEVRTFTNLGTKEVKDVLVEKVPCVLKQGVTKDEGNDIMEKIKGGVAVMEW